MKRFISLILTVTFFCVCYCTNIGAAEIDSSVINIENKEIIFEENSSFSSEQKQHIIEHLLNSPSNVQTYGLLCTLFGHKYTTEVVETITHCASATAPRCLSETWEISTCSRCNHTEGTVIDEYYIECCD